MGRLLGGCRVVSCRAVPCVQCRVVAWYGVTHLAVLRCAVLWCDVVRHDMAWHGMACQAGMACTVCYGTQWYAMLCSVMLLLRYAMLCCGSTCYAILSCVIFWNQTEHSGMQGKVRSDEVNQGDLR